MRSISRYILFTGIGISLISILYFLLLVVHLPFIATVVIILAALFFAGRWFFKNEVAPDTASTYKWWPVLILIPAIFLFIKKIYYLTEVHGEWDAWAIWNLHAKYLTDPEHWQRLFLNTNNAHPDYPLGLPAFIAFFTRLCSGHFATLLPFIFSFAITVFIPVFVYTDTIRKNIVIASAALFFFAQDMHYLNRGGAQYADTLLAFFFLAAVACIYYAGENKKYIVLSTFFAGSCMWVKNEGIILAGIFIAFNYNTFLQPKNLKYFLGGIALPLITVVSFKTLYSNGNDMIDGQRGKTMEFLKDKSRYRMIYDWFKLNLNTHFYYVKIGVFLYALISILQKRLPDRQLLMLFACLAAYMGFYVISPNDLEWHLSTSQDRLMHQLMPAFIFVFAQRFSEIRFTLPEQKLR
jgi:hypothetical protein